MKLLLIAAVMAIALSPADAKPRRSDAGIFQIGGDVVPASRRVHRARASHTNARPRAWCGWWVRQQKNISDPKFNIAHNFMQWGRASFPHVGAVGVMKRRHVGIVVGTCSGGVLLKSGNTWGRGVSNGVGTTCYPLSAFKGFRS